MQPELIIFDCDGVLMDSEVVGFKALTTALKEYGVHIEPTEAIKRYTGRSELAIFNDVQNDYNVTLPPEYLIRKRQLEKEFFESELTSFPGLLELIDILPVKKCVASGSSPERLSHTLKLVRLWERFAPNIFSSAQVKYGKPAPDLFLFAADQMGVGPASCIVIEDSVNGVRAAKAAGMPVFGFTGGSHCGEGHGELLLKEGAEEVFCNMADLSKVLLPLMNQQAAHV